ncbi:MAG: hypothetical protein EBU84_02000 [Actinobacteria bacterium]|jgi:hypothetical protein|nr:hypothetical protein [Actinomycetota bacterium]
MNCECVHDGWECRDCGQNTQDSFEYYMVTDSCWRAAGNVDGFLCVGCLENRLGKRLTPRNFTDCPLNWMNALMLGHASKRLHSRYHSTKTSKWTAGLKSSMVELLFKNNPKPIEALTLMPHEAILQGIILNMLEGPDGN